MLHRTATLLALVALISAPTILQARMVCRFTGMELTDCGEGQLPDAPVAQAGGCCDRQVTRPLGAMLAHAGAEIAPPALPLFAAAAPLALQGALPADRFEKAAPSAGLPLFQRTCALLI